jgi:hypothetical protein
VTKASAERKVISFILAAPARKLFRRFVDARTGLVKNNVQVVCQRRATRSFLCAVRLPTDKPSAGIFVRYSPGRKGEDSFRWYGYRRS